MLLTIRHLTTYRYRQPVAFGEHRMMLRPRESQDQRVVEARLAISPEPARLHSITDGHGNHIGIAGFSGRARELTFESIVSVEHTPPADPFAADDDLEAEDPRHPIAYTDEERAALSACFARDPADPEGAVVAWAQRLLPVSEETIGSWALLKHLSENIHRGFEYRRREAKGTQTAAQTLRLGHGTCRDFAVLMIAAARSLGFAARFVSGYLAAPLDALTDATEGTANETIQGHGSTHAWAQVYLPRLGWVDFDPTNGSVGGRGLISVAVTPVPAEATPLHGTFLGFPADHIGMDVAVTITAGMPSTGTPAPRSA